MLICPVCGFRNPDANDTCFRCSAILKRNAEMVDAAFKRADSKRRRFERFQRIHAPIERIRESRFYQRLNAIPDDDRYRYPFTAGLLSIILPGLGHLYAGQAFKARFLAAFGVAFYITAYVTIHEEWSNYFLFAMLIFWTSIWGGSMAVALRANGAKLVRRHIYALFFAGMMLLGFFLVAGQYLGLGIISLEKITTHGMAPSLVKGERVAFTAIPLWFRQPRAGEIISFNPPRFTAHVVSDSPIPKTVSINIKRYYQRVMGVPGDTVKKEGDKFWRNGKLLSPDERPFGYKKMEDFELTVPAGKFYAPLTQLPEADWLAAFGGSPEVPYMGAPGYSFTLWAGYPFITEDRINAKALAIIDPPPRRKWLP